MALCCERARVVVAVDLLLLLLLPAALPPLCAWLRLVLRVRGAAAPVPLEKGISDPVCEP